MLCPAIFSPHMVCFRIYCLCFGFSLLLHGNQSHCQAVTVCARAQAAILRSSGHSVKEISKLFKNTERWVNKWSKRTSFEDKPRSGRSSVLTNYSRNVIIKAKYKRNNSTRKIGQKVRHHNINISSTTVCMEFDRQRVQSLQAKEDNTVKWEAKKASFEICQEILQAHGRGLGELLIYRWVS